MKPYLYVVPGLGFALVTDDRMELVDVRGDLAFVREVAAALSCLISARPTNKFGEDTRRAAESVLRIFCDRGGEFGIPSSFNERPASLRPPELDYSHFKHGDMGAVPDRSDSSRAALHELESRGYGLFLRNGEHNVAALRWTEPLPVYEVRSRTAADSVIGEGKGLDADRSMASAVGEAVERILGADPQLSTSVVTAAAVELGIGDVELKGFGLGPRDCLSPDFVTDWVYGFEWGSPSSDAVPVPAELVYTSYIANPRVAAVSYRSTTGLSAGRSLEEAVLNGVLEVIERDAYWIVMRSKMQCPEISLRGIERLDPRLLSALAALSDQGLRLHLRNISLDWPVTVVHALLEDTGQRAPAFSHGSGAALCMRTAITRAICEAIQVRSDLCRQLSAELEGYVLPTVIPPPPHLAWSDPLWLPQIDHLRTGAPKHDRRPSDVPELGAPEAVAALQRTLLERGHRVVYCPLGEMGGLHAVRVMITGATQPDPRAERVSERLRQFLALERLPKPYLDPILT